ncbi:hypothetical protein [Robertkochia sediminum]|uniref:hypothetical protein n=1 Tax=Robertkochia sediminum TaxID=2785326 RepID=UPI001931A678|nr:hypothetical protein [Robertkochia sediminum]MBL7472878.1 hypothetical protein [Robertkochia sediminum]
MSLLFMAGSLLLGWNVAAQTVTGSLTQFQAIDTQTYQESPDTRVVLSEIVFIEQEEEVALDFDTAGYLPERFDPHVGDLDRVHFKAMDRSELVELGFAVSDYLPKGFDPYVEDLYALDYKAETEAVVLGFDTGEFLPAGFDAYIGNYSALVFAEEQEAIDLGFDTIAYLPKKFDPHLGDLDQILFVDLDLIAGSCECHSEMVEVLF